MLSTRLILDAAKSIQLFLCVLVAAFTGGCKSAPTSPPKLISNSANIVPQASVVSPHPDFDADKSFAQLKKQCDFGPRPLGSTAHEKTRDYLIEQMKLYADQTVTQVFSYRGMKVTNIIGVFTPVGAVLPVKNPILLLAHWDTRPVADGPNSSELNSGPPFRFGSDGWNRTTPIMGANDGASGVAVLLEMARLLKEKKPPVPVVMLLDDGEDYGDFRGNGGAGEGVELGSRYFAEHPDNPSIYGRPIFGILLDMIGAKHLLIPREIISHQYAPGTNEKVFSIAHELGYDVIFRFNELQDVGDDHVALNKAGIPTIDLIHPLPFAPYQTTGYTFWHTMKDTPDKCSGSSLKVVGDTLLELLFRETPIQ